MTESCCKVSDKTNGVSAISLVFSSRKNEVKYLICVESVKQGTTNGGYLINKSTINQISDGTHGQYNHSPTH